MEIRDRDQRTAGLRALEYLRGSELTNYEDMFHERQEFMARNPDASEKVRKRRLEFVERVGVEVASWPCVFWQLGMCFSYERATDARRFGHDAEYQGAGDDIEEWDDNDDNSRHSTKRMFMAQAMGPLLGIVNRFEVLQYAYDLNLWTALCSNKLLNKGIPMRIMMCG